ncbi:Endonuclease/Exonuclease/phosphatase family protein [Jannaschia seosinensis]|uniref:Endonuclease/Exonuclease/phosphatase family protein n=1 Tax=Jannaschia seosinensis TaxID=313367 RepID=A0A0M7BDP8_9RHOB|nr:endonuclease/exonuclease/phosphatase family protein [Jannaschia seosinensis]CUH39912.1 Endonuclease/Exonuclease/phosphatase family protein [Jannaschia seosinensis]
MRLKIASWNIRKAVGLDWRRDPTRVLRVLKEMAPDIILLQEADRRLAPRHPALPLAQVRAAGWDWIDADPATPSIGHHGNAILMRPGLEVERMVPLELPGLEPRGGILARIGNGEEALTLGALHLGLRRRDRLRQVAKAVSAAAVLGGPVLMGGDLNEWRKRPDALRLPEGWRTISPGASFHAERPTMAFDRFLHGPGLEVRATGVWPRHLAARASDHLPIWIEIA